MRSRAKKTVIGSLAILGPSGSHPWLRGGTEDPWLSVPALRRVWFCLFANVRQSGGRVQSNANDFDYRSTIKWLSPKQLIGSMMNLEKRARRAGSGRSAECRLWVSSSPFQSAQFKHLNGCLRGTPDLRERRSRSTILLLAFHLNNARYFLIESDSR